MSSTNSSENRRSENQVTVANDDPKFKIKKQAVVGIALAALSHLKYTRARLSLIFTSDQVIKKLNQRFLNHNQPTDVLAFPSPVIPAKAGIQNVDPRLKHSGMTSLGEVIISPKRALVQAPIYEATFGEELARYICHGILHLAGFKDKTRKDQRQMRQQENQILKLCRTNIQYLCHSRESGNPWIPDKNIRG